MLWGNIPHPKFISACSIEEAPESAVPNQPLPELLSASLGVQTRHGRMAAAHICAAAWLSLHIICINRGQRLIEIILSVMGGSRG